VPPRDTQGVKTRKCTLCPSRANERVGTSMGGLIGMMLAAQPGNPIRKLVLNDIGPFLSKVGLERIRDYVGLDPTFHSLEAFETTLRATYAAFGPLTDAQ